MTEPMAPSEVVPSVPVARLAHALSIQLVCRALGMVASAVSVAMTARYLGPGHYGQLTIAVAFIGMWMSLVDLGIGRVIVRRVTSGRGELERLVRIYNGVSLVYCVPLAALAAGSGLLVYRDHDVRVMLVVLSGQLLMLTMTTRLEPVFQATIRFSAVAVSDLVGRLAMLAVVGFLVAERTDVIWFAVAQLIPTALQVLIQGSAAARHVSFRPIFAPREIADLLRESLFPMGVTVITVLYWNADGVILSLVNTHSEVGVYGLASTIAMNTLIVSVFFLKSTLSTATELFSRDVAAFAAFVRRSVELMYFLAVPIAVVGVLLAGPLIRLFGNQAFVSRGTPTLALLFIAVALRCVATTLGEDLFASNRQRFWFWLSVATIALNVALNLALDGRFGAVGAGIALVCTELFNMAIAGWWLRRQCGYRTPVLFLLRVLVPTGASVAVTLLLRGQHVVVILATAAAAYLATSATVGPFTWSTLTSLRASSRRKQPDDTTREMDRAYLKRPVGGTTTLPSRRSLAVLIVTHKSHDLLEMCLRSVAEHLPELPVYVYENSGEGYPGRADLAARHPAVHWVSGPVNLGFAAAFNALVEHTPSDTDLLLLKADARLRGPLTRTRELLRQPQVAAVSPMVRDDTAPGRTPWDVATRRLTLIRALVAVAGYSDSLRGTPISHLYAHQPPESRAIQGCLAATCLAISRAAWNAIGGFDEEFFRYGEAADWQNRARVAGWRVLLADELGVDRGNPVTGAGAHTTGSAHGEAVAAAEHCRNRDLARTNAALLLEHQDSVHHADVYLASTTLLERLQPSKRGARNSARAGHHKDLPAIVIVTNRLVYGGAERQKALLATELDRRGYRVTIVCVQRFGPLIKEIPHSVRVVRQPWWAPIVDIPEGPAVLISGDTNTETGFATLWRAGAAGRRWLVAAHTPPEEDRPMTHGH